MKEEQNTKIV